MDIQPTLNYFSIWRATFKLIGKHFGLLTWATLVAVAPFFFVNGIANANNMMTLGDAAMSGSEIPIEQMRILWGTLVGADSLAFLALTVATGVVLKMLRASQQGGFGRHLGRELRQLPRSAGFWIFLVLQFVFFAMINTPDGRFKLAGMALFACSALLFWRSRDPVLAAAGKRRLPWTAWCSLALTVATFAVLYILLNGYVNYFLLMMVDLGGQQIMTLFPPDSAALPFGIITLSKFLSQWLNLLPMTLLLSTYLALRDSNP